MPVIKKEVQLKYETELRSRFQNLIDIVSARELRSSSEGRNRGQWLHPEKLCATQGTDLEIRLAVDDFKLILAEVKEL
jgi:hypothetical protein